MGEDGACRNGDLAVTGFERTPYRCVYYFVELEFVLFGGTCGPRLSE